MPTGYRPYGGDISSWITSIGSVSGTNVLVPAANKPLTVWDSSISGIQITDLLDSDGTTAITGVTANADGKVGLYYAPDTLAEVWLDGGVGPRVRAIPLDADQRAAWGGVSGVPATFPPSAHNHDDRYYTEAEVDAKLVGASAPTLANIPAGSGNWVYYDGSAWPARPTARTDVTVIWVGGTDTTPPTAQISGVDLWLRPAPVA